MQSSITFFFLKPSLSEWNQYCCAEAVVNKSGSVLGKNHILLRSFNNVARLRGMLPSNQAHAILSFAIFNFSCKKCLIFNPDLNFSLLVQDKLVHAVFVENKSMFI